MYEDVVTNATLAEQYRQYMIQYLGMQPEEMVPVEEAKIKHDMAGSSYVADARLRYPLPMTRLTTGWG